MRPASIKNNTGRAEIVVKGPTITYNGQTDPDAETYIVETFPVKLAGQEGRLPCLAVDLDQHGTVPDGKAEPSSCLPGRVAESGGGPGGRSTDGSSSTVLEGVY